MKNISKNDNYNNKTESDKLSLKEVEEQLKIYDINTKTFLRQVGHDSMIKDPLFKYGEIKVVKIGGKYYVAKKDLERFISKYLELKKDYYSTKEYSKITGLSLRTIQRYISKGVIDSVTAMSKKFIKK